MSRLFLTRNIEDGNGRAGRLHFRGLLLHPRIPGHRQQERQGRRAGHRPGRPVGHGCPPSSRQPPPCLTALSAPRLATRLLLSRAVLSVERGVFVQSMISMLVRLAYVVGSPFYTLVIYKVNASVQRGDETHDRPRH